MKNLIVCCDGTWNSPDNKDGKMPAPTNVYDLDGHILPGANVKSFYVEGVGASGGIFERLLGGSIGAGLNRDIWQSYKWLAENYQAGDNIYLFGFSRGSYTARSLAGMIGAVGLMDLTDSALSEKFRKRAAKNAFKRYQKRKINLYKNKPLEDTSSVPERFRPYMRGGEDVPVHFLGVWDTVGALGIPEDLGWLKFAFGNPAKYRFHDTRLGRIVKTARHAVAIDEHRMDFRPTLWVDLHLNQNQDVKQIWFTGVHGDIGGGYANTGLGDITLEWMMQAAHTAGLLFKPGAISGLNGNPQGRLHDSVTKLFKLRPTIPRNVPNLATNDPNLVNPAVGIRRREVTQYWATTTLANGQSSGAIAIPAKKRWVRTGMYLEAGSEYEFTASGTWKDASLPADPDGVKPGFKLGKIAQKISDSYNGVISMLTRLRNADKNQSKWVRRYQNAPWFALIGVVANGDEIAQIGKKPIEYEDFKIGSSASFSPKRSGYLYCYANDAWSFYKNNSGSVDLDIKRIR